MTQQSPMRAATLIALLLAPFACAQPTTNPAPPGPPTPSTPQVVLTAGWWNDAVFYEVFVRSFADSTDGPLAGDGIGDFRGLTSRLDYVQSLGVNALWLMPVTQSPSYHGYDTTDYRTIESDYGTNDDFKAFVAAAHTRGIKVVIDFVINHCSSRHPWFQAAIDPKSDKHDWFIWSDTRPAWNGPWGEVVWHPNPDKSQSNFYYGLFNHDMPDLNYRNPAVTAEIKETTKFWLTEMNVDGFRLDAIRHLIENGKVQENTPETHAWLRDFQAYCKSVKPDCFTVGEVWSDTRTIASYVNGQEMDSAFDFELSARLVEAIKTGKGQTLGDAIRNTCELFPRTVAGSSAAATFLTNHDQTRVMTLLGGDQMKAKAAASILLTMPGTPFIYYGEEIGMEGDKPDPNLRTPMQWTGEPGAGFTTGTPWRKPRSNPKVNVNSQEADRNSLLSHYRKMISIRRENDVLRHGDFTPMATSTPSLLMFRRSLAGQSVVVGVNLTNGVLAHDEIDREPQLRRLKKNGKHPLMVPSELLPGEAFVIGVDN